MKSTNLNESKLRASKRKWSNSKDAVDLSMYQSLPTLPANAAP